MGQLTNLETKLGEVMGLAMAAQAVTAQRRHERYAGTAERATPWTWIRDRAPGPIATQSAYLVITGIWPLVHYRSFEAVTGPKTDAWLVRTVGALSVGFGVALAVSEHRRSLGLSAIATAAFAGTEVVPAVRGRIRRVYLLDAGFQGVLTSLAAYQAARKAA